MEFMGNRTALRSTSVVALLMVIFSSTAYAADGIGEAPRPGDRQVSRVVSMLLPQQHVSRAPLDDQISQRAIKLFLKSLDPMKLYFLQEDVNAFSQYSNQVDDFVKRGDMSVAYTIYKKFLTRVDERTAMAQETLAQPLNLDDDEMMVIEPDAAQYPANNDEARDRMRRQIEYSLLRLLLDDKKPLAEATDILKRRYNRSAQRWHQFSGDELLEVFLTSVTSSFDPHTTYMSPASFENFQISMRLNLEGIGAALQEKDGYTVISKVIPGGAADKNGGIKAEDYIVSVGEGDNGPMVDVVDMKLDDVVKKIRGAAGTTVRLGVKTGGAGETKILSIKRAKVELEDSAARSEVVEVPASETSKPAKIGYINLPSFYLDMEAAQSGASDFRSSTRDVKDILEKFRGKVDCVVLDLRVNGGGSLTEAISLTGLFIDNGPVVQVKDPDGDVKTYSDDLKGTAWDGPLVVLTSQFSASASEIFAGAIQDYNRGIIVGDETTHGKGTVQTLIDLAEALFQNTRREPLGALKLTIQQFYLPDGESTQKRGVHADVILPSLTQHMDVGEADMDYALEYGTVPAAKHRTYGMTPTDVLGVIRAQSASRVEANDEFKDLLRRIETYKTQKDEKFISLNRQKFDERRKQLDAQKEEEKELLDQQTSKDEVYRHNFYNDEALNIARDYVELLRRQNLAAASAR